jgi:hypothetical protein
LLAAAVAVGPATAAHATVDEIRTFTGYGYLPSAAYADAQEQMRAYSPTCRELEVFFTRPGSMHYWTATLTAEC